MRVTATSRRWLRLNNIVFVVLLVAMIGLLGWLSSRYSFQADWTASGRNTLAEASVQLVKRIEGPVTVLGFAREQQLTRERIDDLIRRYQRHKDDLTLEFVDPTTAPQRVRELGVTTDGEVVIQYRGQRENIKQAALDEEAVTNALQRVARGGKRTLGFLTGHGERQPDGNANHDLGNWARQLENKGFRTTTVNLSREGRIPEGIDALVIASPEVDWLPGEVRRVQQYVEDGGNLLWLAEPGDLRGLDPLAEQLGVSFQPGTVVDPTAQLYQINNATFTVVNRYGQHPATRNFNRVTLFPGASALKGGADSWQNQVLLTTGPSAWSETGKVEGEVRFDEGQDISGPLDLGIALSRPEPGARGSDETAKRTQNADAGSARGDKGQAVSGSQQRVLVLGDGDFLSNAGNLDLGMNLANWLTEDDTFMAIPAKTAPDRNLTLSDTASAVMSASFLVILPLGLALAGMVIWVRRRRR